MTRKATYPGTCKRCGQRFAAGTLIDWAPGQGAVHAGVCPPVPLPFGPPGPTPQVALPAAVNGAPIVAFLQAAQQRDLRYPRARILATGGGELRLSVAGAKSKAPGSVQVLLGGEWIGRLEPSGAVVGRLRSRTDVLATLAAIAADPAEAAQRYGALMARCSFCGHPLKDDGSVDAGYGPSCAKAYGLPWQRGGVRALRSIPLSHATA